MLTRQGRRAPDWLKVEKRNDGRGNPLLLDRLPALEDGAGGGDRPRRDRQRHDFGHAALARPDRRPRAEEARGHFRQAPRRMMVAPPLRAGRIAPVAARCVAVGRQLRQRSVELSPLVLKLDRIFDLTARGETRDRVGLHRRAELCGAGRHHQHRRPALEVQPAARRDGLPLQGSGPRQAANPRLPVSRRRLRRLQLHPGGDGPQHRDHRSEPHRLHPARKDVGDHPELPAHRSGDLVPREERQHEMEVRFWDRG